MLLLKKVHNFSVLNFYILFKALLFTLWPWIELIVKVL